jgi:hypothetical protein
MMRGVILVKGSSAKDQGDANDANTNDRCSVGDLAVR